MLKDKIVYKEKKFLGKLHPISACIHIIPVHAPTAPSHMQQNWVMVICFHMNWYVYIYLHLNFLDLYNSPVSTVTVTYFLKIEP